MIPTNPTPKRFPTTDVMTRAFLSITIVEFIALLFLNGKLEITATLISSAIGVIIFFFPILKRAPRHKVIGHLGMTIPAGLVCFLFTAMLIAEVQAKRDESWHIFLRGSTLIEMKNGDALPHKSYLLIKHPEITQGYAWLILREANLHYYPLTQGLDESVCQVYNDTSDKASFNVVGPADVGDAENTRDTFDFIFVVADQEANQSLINTLQNWCKTQKYVGLAQLPSGCKEVGEITLKRAVPVKP